MKEKTRKKLYNFLFGFILAISLLIIWAVLALIIDEELILPKLSVTLKTFFLLFASGEFYLSVGGTLLRAVLSFAISFIVALVLAILSAFKKSIGKVINPLMAIVRSVPTMAIILLLIIWLSPSFAPILISSIVICPTLYSQFQTAIFKVDGGLLQMSKVYKVPTKRIIFKLYIPSISKGVYEASASGFSLNLKIVIAGEALAQTVLSIGKEMNFAKIWLETPTLLAYTLIAVILGVLFEILIRLVGERLTRRKAQ